jgi:hypothetical protein
MIGWDNAWAGHAGRWVWICLPCSMLLSITWAALYVLMILSSVAFLKDITLAKLKFCYFSQQHRCPDISSRYQQISFCTRHFLHMPWCCPGWLHTTLAKQYAATNKTELNGSKTCFNWKLKHTVSLLANISLLACVVNVFIIRNTFALLVIVCSLAS